MKKGLLIFLLIFSMCGVLAASDSLEVDFASSGGSDSIVIKMARGFEPKIFTLKEPDRLVIDIPGAVWDAGKQMKTVEGSVVGSIRWAQNSTSPYNVRIVADLKHKILKDRVSLTNDNMTITVMIPADTAVESATGAVSEESLTKAAEPEKISVSAVNGSDKDPSGQPAAYTLPVDTSPFFKAPKFSKLKKFSVMVNGRKLDLGRKPYFVNNVLMVQAKDLFGCLGFTYEQNMRTGTVKARYRDEIEMLFKEGSRSLTVNSKERKIGAVPVKKLGKLYIPFVSFVKWAGLGAYWDARTKTYYAGPRVTKVSWDDYEGTRSIVLNFSSHISTYEYSEKEKPLVESIRIPGFILDGPLSKIPVKEDGIRGLKLFQAGNVFKMGIYYEKQMPNIIISGKTMVIFYPPVITKVDVTEEAEAVRIDIYSTKPIVPETRTIHDPERIIVDIPGAAYKAVSSFDITKGGISRLRASQFMTSPLVSRIVVDLTRETRYSTASSDDQKYVVLRIEKKEIKQEKSHKVKALKGRRIVIDPGHGGNDPGAFGVSGDGVKEKNLNLSTALKLSRLLSEAGSIVLLAREEDTDITLADRVRFGKNNMADALVCMHYNSTEKPEIAGTETYYYNPNSKLLASLIHKNIVSGLGRADRGLSQVKFYVVYNSEMPSVLVEPLYLSNREEERMATDSRYQERVAQSIFEGLKQYFEVIDRLR